MRGCSGSSGSGTPTTCSVTTRTSRRPCWRSGKANEHQLDARQPRPRRGRQLPPRLRTAGCRNVSQIPRDSASEAAPRPITYARFLGGSVERGSVGSAANSPIRVVLVDDSDDLRVLVRLALDREPDFEVVAEAADGAEGVAA